MPESFFLRSRQGRTYSRNGDPTVDHQCNARTSINNVAGPIGDRGAPNPAMCAKSAAAERSEPLSGALDRFTSQGGNAIYRTMGDGGFLREHGTLANAPQQVDADDPLVVAMKAELGPVECGATGSALPAVLGLPMTHRGELDGFVLIGSKPKQEVFRPDEVELLGHAAQQVGLDLNALQVKKLKRELAALSSEKRSFSELEREMRTMVERALLAKDVPAG